MIDAVKSFSGAAIIVTHNERLLYEIATKLIVFHQEKLFVFHGRYDEFLDDIGWGTQEDVVELKQSDKKPKQIIKTKDMKKIRADFLNRRAKALNPYKQKTTQLETTIQKLEMQMDDDTQNMITASQTQNSAAISTLSKSLHSTRQTV
ncbi:MAG: hypothetical protein QME49_00295 [bacterium]|nr:hypothetical protein [bacterium]